MRFVTFAPCCGVRSGRWPRYPPPALRRAVGWTSTPLSPNPFRVRAPPTQGRAVGQDNSPDGGRLSGWEDASRNTATFAVSREHRVGQGRSGHLNRAGTRQRSRVGRRRAGYGTAERARRVSLQGGQSFAKKDNAGRRYYINPAGLFDWRHGVPVGPPFTRNAKGFFSLSGAATRLDLSLSPK